LTLLKARLPGLRSIENITENCKTMNKTCKDNMENGKYGDLGKKGVKRNPRE